MDVLEQGAAGSAPPASRADSNAPVAPPMLSPQTAWRVLCRRTGGHISRATFYRWVSEGKVLSIRLGIHIFIPRPSLEDLIKRCLAGQRF
jgi:hypothetical protein